MRFRTHIIEKIRDLIGMYYQLQNNGAIFLKRLSNGYAFLDPDFNKVQSPIKIVLLDKLTYY